jgi:PAS domain S-box-containing protein
MTTRLEQEVGPLFRALTDQAPHVLLVFRAEDLRLAFVNAAYERVFGRARAELEQAPLAWLDSVHPDDRERVRTSLHARRPGAPPESVGAFRIVDADGRTRWLHGDVHPLEAMEDGRPVHYWVETLRDVTESRAARARELHDRQLTDRLVDMLGALVVETDAAGHVVWWNDAVSERSARPLDAARGSHIVDLVSPDRQDQQKVAGALATMRGTGRYHVGIRRLDGPSGASRDVDWWVAPLRDDEGAVHGFLGLGHDVTAERHATRALRASDRRFADLLQNLPDVPWLLSLETGEFEYHGPGFHCLWGRSPPTGANAVAQLEGWVHPDDRETMKAAFAAVVRGKPGSTCEVDYRVVQPSGEIRWLHTRALTIADEDGVPAKLAGFSMDVTARQSTLRALRESELLVRSMSEAMEEVFFLAETDRSKVHYVNSAIERVWGLTVEAVMANPLSFLDAIHPDDRAIVARKIAENRAQPRASSLVESEYRIVRPNGEIRWIRSRTYPLESVEGSHRTVGLLTDVTDQKLAELARRESEERLRQMSEAMREVFFLLSLDRKQVHFVNAAFERIWGFSREALIADPQRFRASVHPDDRATFERYVAATQRVSAEPREHEVEYRILRGDGEVRWIHGRSYPVVEPDGTVRSLVGLMTDVTERREAEQALGEREELLRQMSEAMREAFFLVSVDRTKIHYVNPAFEQLWGVPGELVLRDPTRLFAAIHPDDRSRVGAEIAAAIACGDHQREEHHEFRILRPDGTTRWIEARTYPVRGPDGRVDRVVGLHTDITDRKAMELALVERTEQLETSLREKDVLLAEVHHRVKNNLQAITGLMHLMAAQAHRRPLRETIEELERRIQAMALVHETLYRSPSLAAVDMKAYLERIAMTLVSATDAQQRSISVHVHATATMDLERAMRCGLIVNELLNNALKHAFGGRERGRIDVELEGRGGSSYALRVSDDGVGLPSELDFDSEETLGLRLVAGLAQQIGGAARRLPGERSAIEIVFVAEG